MSRIEAGLLDFCYTDVDVNSCIRKLEDAFHFRMPANVKCVTEFGMKKCYIHTEKNRLMQVLGNYFSNAIKYTNHGSITIGYYPPKNEKSVSMYGIQVVVFPPINNKPFFSVL